MSDAAPPAVPFVEPPSIEQAVNEHLGVVRELRDVTDAQLRLERSINNLTADHRRLANEQSVDRLTLGRIERLLMDIRADQLKTERLRTAVLKAVASV